MKTFSTIDAYIAVQPKEHREKLEILKNLIEKLAPDAVSSISYGMPWYKYYGKPLVYFACAKNHIGFYPTPRGIEPFKKELQEYKTSKGAIQFPHDEELPLQLIRKIVEFRVQENKTL